MPQQIAVLRGNKIVEIIARRPGAKITRDCDRLVDITARPDLKVGATWPFGPAPAPTPKEA